MAMFVGDEYFARIEQRDPFVAGIDWDPGRCERY